MKPLLLIILDGWGHRAEKKDNGIALAKTPHFDHLWKSYPHTLIDGSGKAVGLPAGIMGNSEVGHMNLGAGRIVYSGLSQIYHAIEDGSFFDNPALLGATQSAKLNRSALHLMGLVSDGAVHSHQDHLYALLDLAKRQRIEKVFVHCFLDGRDTAPRDGIKFIRRLEEQIGKIGVGRIAGIHGRYYAMDRDKRWERIERAYDVLTGWNPGGVHLAEEYLAREYQQGNGDEFIPPESVLDEKGRPIGPIRDGDAVIFFNFRADRARQITQALTGPFFMEFNRKIIPKISAFVCMAPYDNFSLPVAFWPSYPQRIFGEIVSENGLAQLRIAETEKYAHVTYFFNGGRDVAFPGEERILIPSPREVPTYDQKPEMSALLVADELINRINEDKYDVIILNFANADMVGHTAKPEAIVRAVETVDECVGRIVDLVLKMKGMAIITADHGNAEQMKDDAGGPHTAHTTNLVPFMLVSDAHRKNHLKKSGGHLCDVAPTLLELLHIPKPREMTGENLIVAE
ncbi:MAG: 2,3-bisphosphoglycerate-independent phosphoglycerate mutase [Deltaproteobacteria bacterium]|nr:2,3-bisphosphoglycerate-independent phosphoglycerate mutase [Deltaproteobacteria bacterium]